MFSDTSKKRVTPLPHDEARALLREYYLVGDKVDIDLLRQGTIVGFGVKHVHRGGINHKMAGTYINYESLRVIPDLRALPERFVLLSTLRGPRSGYDFENRNRIKDIFVRIGDLPETPFWEGDTVAYLRTVHDCGPSDEWLVYGIDHADESGPIFHAWPIRDGKPCNDAATAEPATELKLIERGNLWKMGHGEPLEFADIEEEAKFYHSLGMSQKVYRNSRVSGEETGWYEYDFADAVSLIRSGRGQEMKVKNSKHMTFVVIKYDDEEFGKRMRAHTLARFGLGEEVSA
jgi:hypothetical protein